MSAVKKKNLIIINIAFGITLAAILFFLAKAPEITTPHLPRDEDHNRFFSMKKKEASKLCIECHSADEVYEIHKESTPNTNRCLFCHRRD